MKVGCEDVLEGDSPRGGRHGADRRYRGLAVLPRLGGAFRGRVAGRGRLRGAEFRIRAADLLEPGHADGADGPRVIRSCAVASVVAPGRAVRPAAARRAAASVLVW